MTRRSWFEWVGSALVWAKLGPATIELPAVETPPPKPPVKLGCLMARVYPDSDKVWVAILDDDGPPAKREVSTGLLTNGEVGDFVLVQGEIHSEEVVADFIGFTESAI